MVEKYYGKKAALVVGLFVFFLLPGLWFWMNALSDPSKYTTFFFFIGLSILFLSIYVPTSLREIREENEEKDPD